MVRLYQTRPECHVGTHLCHHIDTTVPIALFYIIMMTLLSATPSEMPRLLATRAKALRIARGLTQAELAERAGIKLSTLRAFERSGRIALHRLLAVAHVLGGMSEFQTLFPPPAARTMAELEALSERRTRKYGRSMRPPRGEAR
jgi:transcriptional regulator with XRE-family HTH domain